MTLRERREQMGLRQEDVAKLIDVDQTTVSLWETGKSTPIRIFRKQLAKLYDCTEDELFPNAGKTAGPAKVRRAQ